MNLKVSLLCLPVALLMCFSQANAQSGAQAAAPAFGGGGSSVLSGPILGGGSATQIAAPAPSFGSGTQFAAPVQSFGSGTQIAAPVQSFGSSTQLGAPVQSFSQPQQSFSVPSSGGGCGCHSAAPVYSAPVYSPAPIRVFRRSCCGCGN